MVARLPRLGQTVAIVALVGAGFGYPLLLWLDPLVVFSSCIGFCQRPTTGLAMLADLALPGLVLINFALPGVWCGRLCPLGGLQELLATPKRAVLRLLEKSDKPTDASADWKLTRRSGLALGLGAAWSLLILRPAKSLAKVIPLRPPGAAGEDQFGGLCVRCGNCTRACPTNILHLDVGEHGVGSFLTPVVRFEDDTPKQAFSDVPDDATTARYCREDCNRCGQVCPSGAIRRFSQEQKKQGKAETRIGLAGVDMDVCILNEQMCQICMQECPFEAISTSWDEQQYMSVLQVDPANCPGCGLCQIVCPTEPVKAIIVEPVPERSSRRSPNV